MDKLVVAAFDFDVTMTTKDTFVPFLYRAFGKSKVRLIFLKQSFNAVKVVLGLSDRDHFKKLIVNALFKEHSVDRLEKVGQMHAVDIYRWLRSSAIERLEWHRAQGHRLVMVSASLELYLKPIAAKLGFDNLLCTNLTSNGLFFSGEISGNNCRGPEKVARLEGLLGDLSNYEIYAYGDSSGDQEMLRIANHPFFRSFMTEYEHATILRN